MPGGAAAAWPIIRDMFQSIAARVDDVPCCQWLGDGGAGHYVKMVHNGIEYGDMQLVSEIYWILQELLGFSPADMHAIFSRWNGGKLDSYLMEITTAILAFNDSDGKPLIGKILDAAFWAEDGKDSWPNPGLEAAAAEAVSQGSWGPDSGIGSAVPSLGTTATRTLCRDRFSGGVEDTDSAADWRVCATGKSSAGAENIPWQ